MCVLDVKITSILVHEAPSGVPVPYIIIFAHTPLEFALQWTTDGAVSFGRSNSGNLSRLEQHGSQVFYIVFQLQLLENAAIMEDNSVLGYNETDKPLLSAIDSRASTSDILNIIASDPLAAKNERSVNMQLIPLHAAIVKRCDPEVVKALLDCWPDSIHELLPYDGKTCLHLAVSPWRQSRLKTSTPDSRVVRLLIEANPESARVFDHCGSLPLHCAAENSPLQMDVLKLLVDAFPDGPKTKKHPTWGSAEYYPFQLVQQGCPSGQEVIDYLASLFPDAVTAEVPEVDIGSFDR